MSLRRRMDALENALAQRELRRLYEATATEYGLDPDELRAFAECFFRQSLEDQLAEVDRHVAALGAEGLDVAAIKATLIEHYRP
jgi:hypothetical protein